MLANLAVFLNNSGRKIAIVDLDAETPQKLKSSFPRSINLQEYADITVISQNQDSRYHLDSLIGFIEKLSETFLCILWAYLK